MNHNADLTGKGLKKTNLFGEEFRFLTAPGSKGANDLIACLQGSTENGTPIRDFCQHAVCLCNSGIVGSILNRQVLSGFGNFDRQTVVAVRIKGNSKGTIGLFRTVIFYDFGNQISFCLIKKTDDSAVKANSIDHFIQYFAQDFIQLGLIGHIGVDPKNTFQQLFLVKHG